MRTTPPETLEGAQVWDLVARLGGQMRVVVGLEGAVVTGWDMNAALALGAALGIAPVVLAECLPELEAVMVAARKTEERE